MEQNLNTKLTRIENTVNIMKTNLHLPEDEVIEKVAEATNLHSLANIFIQEEEPEIKDGIWIQANKESHPYDTIRFGGDIVIPGQWRLDERTPKTMYSTNEVVALRGHEGNFVVHQGKIYVKGYWPNYLGEYNVDTNIVTPICDIPGSQSGAITANDNYVIVSGADDWFVAYNIDTKEVRQYTIENASRIHRTCYCAYDNSFYAFCSSNYAFYKVNPETGASERVDAISVYNNRAGYFTFMGQHLVIIKNYRSPYVTVYDIGDNYTKIYDKSIPGLPSSDAESFEMGKYVYYHISSSQMIYRLNKETYECENVTDQFDLTSFNKDNCYGMFGYQDKIYMAYLIEKDTYHAKAIAFYHMDTITQEYDDSSIIVMQTPISKGEYRTAIWTYPNLDGRMLFSFYDVFYYNKDTGFDFTVSMYYGNGTEWVKFKG